MLIAEPIVFAIFCGFSILIFRIVLSHWPIKLTGPWLQIIVSTLCGCLLWSILLVWSLTTGQISGVEINDGICGILILGCAFWCNYWISNLAGGFRAQMALNLAMQSKPISLDEWMQKFGGMGMDAFLADRTKSILIPWRIAYLREDKMVLLPGRGNFFGKLMKTLGFIFFSLRH